ncbi:helix-turn-helix transcriptional regulator [Rhizobium sp. CNPSo 4062]|uniref:helix-turn-helix domain-containing protein n=1 Tax=Rhizobium sp. CNPSo 4062 TaxID=3021410 RepID=UPI00254DC42E|nr:helix-turn-helix transcriptional regulator [Rhizobium sp. CNPSo 4062]MDK4703871.1 helix-turn-helix transcriptional regulator [Rhizobium sp. CNPSo 4062]
MAKRIENIDIEVGARIKEFRKIRGVTQTGLADALGVTFQQVQKYEKGTNRVSVGSLVAICRVLHIDPMDLLGVYFGRSESIEKPALLAEVKTLRTKLSDIQQLCA